MARKPAKTDDVVDTDGLVELMDHSIDVAARDAGAWIENNRVIPGIVFRAKGMDAPEIQALDIALSGERPPDYESDKEVRIERNIYENRRKCEAGIVDWKPFKLRGDVVEYSDAAKKKLLRDPHFRKFLLAAMHAMDRADNIAIQWRKDAEKNSGDGSDERFDSEDKAAA